MLLSNIRRFQEVARQFGARPPSPQARQAARKVDTPLLLCERGARNPYAPHLERQH